MAFGLGLEPIEYCFLIKRNHFIKKQYDTDIQLKTLSRRIEVFNMKIIMRRDSMIFYPENHRIDNAVRRCLSNWNLIFQFEKSMKPSYQELV